MYPICHNSCDSFNFALLPKLFSSLTFNWYHSYSSLVFLNIFWLYLLPSHFTYHSYVMQCQYLDKQFSSFSCRRISHLRTVMLYTSSSFLVCYLNVIMVLTHIFLMLLKLFNPTRWSCDKSSHNFSSWTLSSHPSSTVKRIQLQMRRINLNDSNQANFIYSPLARSCTHVLPMIS